MGVSGQREIQQLSDLPCAVKYRTVQGFCADQIPSAARSAVHTSLVDRQMYTAAICCVTDWLSSWDQGGVGGVGSGAGHVLPAACGWSFTTFTTAQMQFIVCKELRLLMLCFIQSLKTLYTLVIELQAGRRYGSLTADNKQLEPNTKSIGPGGQEISSFTFSRWRIS